MTAISPTKLVLFLLLALTAHVMAESPTSAATTDTSTGTTATTPTPTTSSSMPVPWSTSQVIPPEHFGGRKLGADPQLFTSCGIKAMQIRHWAQQYPNSVTECVKILGPEAGFLSAPNIAAIGQVCDARVDGEATPCYTGYKYMLWNAKVREDEFLNDPSKLPKDKACSPCIKALVEYEVKMLQAYKNANHSVPEMTQAPALPHVYVTTTATVTSVMTVPNSTPPTKTVITFPATSSSGYPWRIEVPAFPNDDAIDRISVHCGWKSAADVKGKGSNNAGSTTGSGAAQAVDMLGARGAKGVVAAAGVTAMLVAVMGMV
ncbi:hypothetical protein AMAG_08435 [Allomyces macrogynus ATCC 38327]|uniref:Uncharacterized protein n=1 Tax=Allomyces macrogynus (strain ATCC 38327) TaxID=578462 RepID=A0A0L0SLM9_ALLM3|nr:hypothetical protein AMAG_08435 [Allomyces macrogynus ATCC 38327]|eukprot:KNE63294.1 hypothetical protein AMAG_08435 [Allomyces macrogynus ATCC 38327]